MDGCGHDNDVQAYNQLAVLGVNGYCTNWTYINLRICNMNISELQLGAMNSMIDVHASSLWLVTVVRGFRALALTRNLSRIYP